jgi:hypothetical protein
LGRSALHPPQHGRHGDGLGGGIAQHAVGRKGSASEATRRWLRWRVR